MESVNLAEGDSSHHPEGFVVESIPGMESVVATVSGYHGAERFKLIRLIATTGANYVGAMGRSTTHLVCWQYEGNKYDLAKRIGACIISHSWFEDCLKEGKRIPEDPYTMFSGQESGPITWELPRNFITHQRGKKIMSRERTGLSDKSNALDFGKAFVVSGSHINPESLSWSDSQLFNEADNQTLQKFCNSSKKRLFNSFIQDDVISEQSNRAHRIIKKKYCNLLDYVSLSKKPKAYRGYADHSKVLKLRSTCTRSTNLSPSRKRSKTSLPKRREDFVSGEEGSGVRPIIEVEDVEDFAIDNNLLKNSNNSRDSNSLSNCELSLEEHYADTSRQVISSDTSMDDSKQNEEANNHSEAAPLHEEPDVSCAICWTDFCSTRGVIPCGHRFCYSCISEWANHMASKGKVSTCPFCKACFTSIIKIEAGSFDQKIYSQTIPCEAPGIDTLVVGNRVNGSYRTGLPDPVCYQCASREPEDLLLSCRICERWWVHSYCLDPYIVPWICSHCKDIRVLYQRFR